MELNYAVILCTVAGLQLLPAATVTIDNFQAPGTSAAAVDTAPSSRTVVPQSGVSGALGNQRALIAQLPATATAGTLSTGYVPGMVEMQMSGLTVTSASNSDAELFYGGTGNFLNEDFSGLGSSFNFVVDFNSVAITGPATMMLDLALTSASGGASQNVSVPFSSGATSVQFSSSLFTVIDFHDVDSIDLSAFGTFSTGGSFDIQIDNFTAQSVPEPTSVALLGIAGCTVLLRRRLT